MKTPNSLVVEEGERLGFRHDLIREETYSALPVSARRALHREAAAALVSIDGSATELAANGLTNRAITDELSLSPHTVESHLRHAFHKLDLRSRVELTRIVLTHDPKPTNHPVRRSLVPRRVAHHRSRCPF